MFVSVVIPTFQRPDWIVRSIRSMAAQTRPPNEVIAVARDTDTPTHQSVAKLQTEKLPFSLELALVSNPGFLPPVQEGFRCAKGDIIAVMDDDAEALEHYIERLISHYSDPTVGAVGGRCIDMHNDQEKPMPYVNRVGYINLLGRPVGNMYKRPLFTEPKEVAFMMGGCMSYRREVTQRLEFDMELNRNVGYNYEVDLGLQVRAMGYKILFDPTAAIRHYSAPRAIAGNREYTNHESTFFSAHNEARVMLRRLPTWHKTIFLSVAVLVGERRAPGIIPMVISPIAKRLGYQVAVASDAIKGRLHAVRGVLLPSYQE